MKGKPGDEVAGLQSGAPSGLSRLWPAHFRGTDIHVFANLAGFACARRQSFRTPPSSPSMQKLKAEC
ncbi:MAG: hypothetical protein GTO18_10875 [Anaerolineales bacterium]|nr:hypothetical protein [Anaerolineales bacterium]